MIAEGVSNSTAKKSDFNLLNPTYGFNKIALFSCFIEKKGEKVVIQ